MRFGLRALALVPALYRINRSVYALAPLPAVGDALKAALFLRGCGY